MGDEAPQLTAAQQEALRPAAGGAQSAAGPSRCPGPPAHLLPRQLCKEQPHVALQPL
jgi:hypothetical protein